MKKPFNIFSLLLTIALVSSASWGSYASSRHDTVIKKADKFPVEYIQVMHSATVVINNYNPNTVAILVEQFVDEVIPEYYVPQTIGKVINKPAKNYRWINVQHWYLREPLFC